MFKSVGEDAKTDLLNRVQRLEVGQRIGHAQLLQCIATLLETCGAEAASLELDGTEAHTSKRFGLVAHLLQFTDRAACFLELREAIATRLELGRRHPSTPQLVRTIVGLVELLYGEAGLKHVQRIRRSREVAGEDEGIAGGGSGEFRAHPLL